ncbi:MAG: aminotransferase class I/II-fold pyridoxal phosphate-dependent enzyme [Thermoplasmatota archaeon]
MEGAGAVDGGEVRRGPRFLLRSAEAFRHLEWLEGHKDARLNLGSSSVQTLNLGDVGPLDPAQPVGWGLPNGDPELVELISDIYRVDRECVLVTNGAGEANLHIALACVERGSEVVCERPAYHSLEAVPRLLGARVVHIERRLESGFSIDLEELKVKVTRKCRIVILTNLHNPSCALLDAGTLRAVAEVAGDAGALVLSDEVYLDCAESSPGPLATLAPNGVSINSLSKAYGAGGFRMGWMLAPPDVVRAVRSIRDHTLIAPNRIGEEVAKNLLRRRGEVLERTRRITRANMETMARWVNGRSDIEWLRPPAGTTCFPRVLKKTPTLELASRLYAEESTLVCPGEFFRAGGHLRIGLGQEPAVMQPALEALGRVLDRAR